MIEALKAHSEYFNALLSSSMKEAREQTIRVPEDWTDDSLEIFLRLHSLTLCY